MKAVQQRWVVIVAMAFLFCLTGLVMSGTAFGDRCVDNGDGTITDNSTGLMWQKDKAGPMNWHEAAGYTYGLSLGGHFDWKLPNRRALGVEEVPECIIDGGTEFYWSSDTDSGPFVHTEVAYVVQVSSGHPALIKKSLNYIYVMSTQQGIYVRAMRFRQ